MRTSIQNVRVMIDDGRDSAAMAAFERSSAWSVFAVFLKLGLMSFGGPIAHLGYFRQEFVARRKWLTDNAYADLVALCQFLPGPASSQVGIALGASRAGLRGAFAAWLGFTMPSALLMIAFGYGLQFLRAANAGWLHGLKIAAVAVVAQAVWSMGRQLTPDRERASLAAGATLLVLVWPNAIAQVAVIALGGLLGWRFLAAPSVPTYEHRMTFPIARRSAWIPWSLFFGLLVALPLLAHVTDNHALAIADSFYRAGSLVFGGGHVVLPLLRAEVVPPGWVSNDVFLAGYGMAQAVPGPLFTFAAYLGAVMAGDPHGWLGGLLALSAIFLPAFLLVLGALPYWNVWRERPAMRAALNGVNAAVVGILLAALYDPIFTSAVHSRADFALAAVCFVLLALWKTPPVWVVALAALTGAATGN